MDLPENTSSEPSGARAISRRAFAVGTAGAIGSLFLEPVLGKKNTFWLPGAGAEQAYADETATVTVPAGTFTVACPGPEIRLDATRDGTDISCFGDGTFKKAPVSDVKIRIKSLYNGKEVEAKSDENGFATFDLEPLACKTHSDIVGDFWEFDASITIDPTGSSTFSGLKYDPYRLGLDIDWYTPDYRQVVIPRIHIMGGTAIQAPMVDVGGKPYFRSISFDDWDIQYNEQDFRRSPSNDAAHAIAAELHFPAAAKYAVRPIISKSGNAERVGCALAAAQVVEGAAGEFKAIKFDGAKYLYEDGAEHGKADVVDALLEGESVSLVISDPSKSGSEADLYTVQTGLSAFTAPCGEDAQQGSDKISPITSDDFEYPGSDDASVQSAGESPSDDDEQVMALAGNTGLRSIENPTFHIPTSESWPKALRDLKVSCWAPSLPIVFRYDPIGSILFGVDIELFNYSNAADVYTGDRTWRSQPRASFLDQCDRKQQYFRNKIKAYNDMKASNIANGSKFAHKSFWSITLTGSFQLIASLNYDKAKKLWSGDLGLVLGGTLGGSFTLQFVVVSFPIYVKFELWASLSFGCSWGIESNVAQAESNAPDIVKSLSAIMSGIRFLPTGADRDLTLQIGAAASLGAGMEGLASAGVRCSGGVSFSWQWRANAANSEKLDPRLIIGGHAEVAIFGEIFGLRGTWTVWSDKWPSLYDSDNSLKNHLKRKNISSLSALAGDEVSEGPMEPECSCLQPGGDYYMPGIGDATLSSASVAATGGPDFSTFKLVTSDELDNVAEIVAEAGKSTVDESGTSSLAASDEATSEYTYSWIGGHGSEYASRGAAGDVIYKLGDRGGVLPFHLNLLAKDVFSAAHGKLIDVHGARYLFRIAPVKYDEGVRMRLVYQRITDTEASDPFPVEFEAPGIDIDRAKLYDYNFDVRIVGNESGSPRVLLMIISGERPNGDETTIFEAAETSAASTVMLEHRGVQTSADQGDFATIGSMSWQYRPEAGEEKYYLIRSPKIMVRDDDSAAAFDRLSSDGFDHEFGFCIVKKSDAKEDLLTPDKGEAGISVVHFSFNDDSYDSMEILNMSVPAGTTALVPDGLQNAPSDEHAVFATLGYRSNDGCGVCSLKIGFEKSDDGRNLMKTVESIPVIDVDESVKGLHPWDGANTLIASVANDSADEADANTGYFARVALPPVEEIEKHLGDTEPFSTFDMTCVSSNDVPLGGVSMRLGHKYCYYATNHSGVKGYDIAEDGTQTPHVDDPSYLIKAFAEIDGVFTKSFILAQCDHPIDSFFAVEDASGNSTSKTSFVTRHVTSAAESKADLYAFDVPFLRSIKVDTAVPVPNELVPGEANAFDVTVTNSGNTVLTQSTLQFIDADDGTVISEITLDFNEATNSANDGLDDEAYAQDKMSGADLANVLVADNGNAVLIPGQTRSFSVKVDIPEGWSGTKKLTIKAESNDMSYIDPNTGKETSSGKGIALYDEEESTSATIEVTMRSDTDCELALTGLTGEMASSGSDGSAGNSGSADGASGAKQAAKTGDAPFMPVAAAAAVAAAGFAAYSARRTRLERQAEAGGEQDEE